MQRKLCDLRKIVLLDRFSFSHERLNLTRGQNIGQYKKSLYILLFHRYSNIKEKVNIFY